MEYPALTLNMTIVKLELTADEVRDLEEGNLGSLDFECLYIFLNKEEWADFKNEVSQS